MPRVRAGSDSKWANKASQSTAEYVSGVQNPRQSWQQATVNAQENYKAGVTQAAAEGRFAKGVTKAGDSKWQTNAVQKGEQRFAQGVQQGQNAYAQGVAPFLSTIESTNLPPRYPSGDPRNIQRVVAIATALRNKKVKG